MQKLVKIIIVSLFAYIFIISNAFAFENLKFNGFISDNANILTESTESNLNNILHELQDKTKAEIAIVTLNSLNDKSIEDVALQIFRKYKFGDKKLNNGALFLVAPNERKVRFEIGYGLEGVITDAHSGMITDYYVIPKFKQNDYENGIINGTIALANDIAESYGQTLSVSRPNIKSYQHSNQMSDSIFTDENLPIALKILFGLIFIVILLMIVGWVCGFIYFIISLIVTLICFIIGKPIPDRFKISVSTSSGSSSGWSSSSSSHSSSSSSDSSRSSFGGGSSGGGGSSRSW